MREQQEDIKTKRFLNEKNLDNSNFALETHRRNNARDKSKRHTRKHEKRKTQDALERLRENTFKSKDKQDIVTY